MRIACGTDVGHAFLKKGGDIMEALGIEIIEERIILKCVRHLLLAAALIGSLAVVGSLFAQGNERSDTGETYRAKQILGSKVLIQGDQSVGTVDDIVLDEHGNVDYLIVMNKDKLVTVPWDAARFNPEKR